MYLLLKTNDITHSVYGTRAIMFFKILFFSFILNLKLTQSNNLRFEETFINPDYDTIMGTNAETAEKLNLRKSFLDKKSQTERQKHQLEILDKLNTNETSSIIFEGDIPHYRVDADHKALKKIAREFKSLITMKGFKYFYKRYLYWRTWRALKYPDGKTRVINYKYHSECKIHVNTSVSDCNKGFWSIEEATPPCPYEILSLPGKYVYCAVKHSKLYRKITKCPTHIDMTALTGTCHNPIVTEWKFVKDYRQRSKRNRAKILSQGRHEFELLTLYLIRPQEIIFRIVNENDTIIYSRIMRSGSQNFACTKDCGKIDRRNYNLVPASKPLTIDLFKGNQHNKRESFKKNEIDINIASNTNLLDASDLDTSKDISEGYKRTTRDTAEVYSERTIDTAEVSKETTIDKSEEVTSEPTTKDDWLEHSEIGTTPMEHNHMIGNYWQRHKYHAPKLKSEPYKISRKEHCKKLLDAHLKLKLQSDSNDESSSED